MSWFYFSFVDVDRPAGDRFLGGCYVQVPAAAEDLEHDDMLWETLRRSHELAINPGGEVQAVGPMPDEKARLAAGPGNLERLLTRDEILGRPHN